jgi:hypothetical protein
VTFLDLFGVLLLSEWGGEGGYSVISKNFP